MKIRNGFVSNSSSSSFVLVVDKEAHEQAVEKLKNHKYVSILKDILSGVGQDKFLGRPVVVITGSNSHGERTLGGFDEYDFNYEDWVDQDVIDKLEIPEGKLEDYRWDIQELVVDGVWEDYLRAVPADSQICHTVDM